MINAIFEKVDGTYVMTGYAAEGYSSSSETEKVVETSEQELVNILNSNLSETIEVFENYTNHLVFESGDIVFSEKEVSEV